MRRKVLIILVFVLIPFLAAGAYGYYRIQSHSTCHDVFKRYNDKSNIACFSTSRGIMIFELDPSAAPKSVEHFKELANTHQFYDGTEFYRVVKDFVVQGGIQDYQIRVGRDTQINDERMRRKVELSDKKIETEANLDKVGISKEEADRIVQEGFRSNTNLNSKPFDYGSLSFANAGPDTNSTEIFIVSSKDPKSQNVMYLNGRFTNFGKIIEGKDVLDSINQVQVNKRSSTSADKPLEPIKVFEVRVK